MWPTSSRTLPCILFFILIQWFNNPDAAGGREFFKTRRSVGERSTSMGAKKGDRVLVHYKGMLENGEVFDSSEGRKPLEFIVGAGQMIPGFDRGVVGMEIGDEKTLILSPEDAYGEWEEEKLFAVKKGLLPKGYEPFPGDSLQMMTKSGAPITVKVHSFEDGTVNLDANHALAGKELTFEVKLVEIIVK